MLDFHVDCDTTHRRWITKFSRIPVSTGTAYVDKHDKLKGFYKSMPGILRLETSIIVNLRYPDPPDDDKISD